MPDVKLTQIPIESQTGTVVLFHLNEPGLDMNLGGHLVQSLDGALNGVQILHRGANKQHAQTVIKKNAFRRKQIHPQRREKVPRGQADIHRAVGDGHKRNPPLP